MKKHFYPLLLALLSFSGIATAQENMGIGTLTPDSTAILDIVSNDKGVLLPRLTTVQRNNIAAPATGLIIYNSDNQVFEYFNGISWSLLATTSNVYWNSTANNIYNSNPGYVGIGTSEPKYQLHVHNPDSSGAAIKLSDPNLGYIVGIDETEGYFQIGLDTTTDAPPISIFVIKPDKRIGINTNNPQEQLHIKGSIGNDAKIKFEGSSTKDYIVGIDETEGVFKIAQDTSGVIGAPPISIFIIDEQGRAGIRQIDTSAQFYVGGKMVVEEVEVANPTTGEKFSLSASGSGTPIWSTSSIGMLDAYLDLYETSAMAAITSAPQKINWDAVRVAGSSSIYSVSGTQITFAEKGYYKISYSVGFQGSGSGAQNGYATLLLDSAPIPGSAGYCELGSVASVSKSSITRTIILEVPTAGKVLELQIKEASGGGSIQTIAGATGLSIEKISE